MKRNLLSIFMFCLLVAAPAFSFAQAAYTRVTSASDLEVGAHYLIVGFTDDGTPYAMSFQKSNNRHAVAVSEAGDAITATVATAATSQVDPFDFILGGGNGAWTFFDYLNEGYLYAAGGGNCLKTQGNLTDNGKWSITFESDGACVPVSNGDVEQKYMHFNPNNGSPLFGCYKATTSVTDPVYLYKAAGTVEPDPEPSNYPTAFTASVDKIEITLTWTDATGSQLPAKYLVLASTGNITVPTDGVPVPNSEFAMNVNYGVETVTFTNLDGNTTYHFAIFPYTNGGDLIDYKTSSGYPTASAQTEDIYLLINEPFDEELGVFTAYDVYGDQNWHNGNYQGNHYAYMNGYTNNTGALQNEDWLISPALNGNYDMLLLSFRTAKNHEGDDLSLKVSSDYDGVSEPSDFDWEEITDMFDWSTGNFTWVESGIYNIKEYVGATFYLAFVYNSTDAAAAAWEVDDVKLMASSPVSVGEQSAKSFKVTPNPANDAIHFDLNQQAQVNVFDLSGRMVSEARMSAGAATLDVAALENGIYFLSVTYTDGKKDVTRFVKF